MLKVAHIPMKVRPQTPKPPFPYRDESFAIGSSDGVTLGATLSIPIGVAHPNVVILVHGSGPGNRDEDGAGHQIFAVLGDYLARHGLAVLRYDKRGVGRSTGDYYQHTTAQLVDDLSAVTKKLKTHKEFNHLGLIGLSEGPGLAAAVAAREGDSVDFVISLAGVGLPGLDNMLLQDRIWAQGHGASPAETDEVMIYVRKYYETVIAQPNVEPRIAALKALYAGLSVDDQALVKKLKMNIGTLSLEQAAQPSLRTLLMSNPALDWRAVHCPVLVLSGSLDRQVPSEENLGGIVAALKAGGNHRVESSVLPSLNHVFQTAKTGDESEYEKIDETMAPVALERIAAFSVQN
jgi:pimeloyl-ACP methyl ester carboxylesterase